jgi:hypothetical protein
MTEATTTSPIAATKQTEQPKRRRQYGEKSTRTLTLSEVDSALAVYDTSIRLNTELVRTNLTSVDAIPSDVLRDLSVANKLKARLNMCRIALLIETRDMTVMELIDKLCKLKPTKATG